MTQKRAPGFIDEPNRYSNKCGRVEAPLGDAPVLVSKHADARRNDRGSASADHGKELQASANTLMREEMIEEAHRRTMEKSSRH
jgi:hypothetical protein